MSFFLYNLLEVFEMEKKLPKVFANKIDKELHNNERVYVSNREEERSSVEVEGMNVSQKINTIFKSKNYIYKADVEIKQNGGTVVKKIIGRNGDRLITIDNEIIPIHTIEDIRLVNEK